jgi:protein ImuA
MSAAIAVSTTAPDRVLDLRLQIERMERAGTAMRPASGAIVSLGSPTLDAALPWGGLPAVGLHEVFGDTSALGFSAALLARLPTKGPILWCQAGRDLYGQGLALYGLDPARLILVHGRTDTDTLWAMEEGLATPGLAAVVGLPHKVPPIAGRRLQLAAEEHGTFALLLRPLDLHAGPRAGAELAATSMALTRWRVAAAPSEAVMARGEIIGLGPERWRLELQRCRLSAAQDSTSKYAGHPKTWQVEWHHETGDLSMVAALRDGSAEPHRLAS